MLRKIFGNLWFDYTEITVGIMIVAIIPARGGSRRIPQKNIKPFLGQPMIAYSINAARETGLFDKIVVSTDSDEIATISKKYGAEVPFIRPPALSDDHIGTDPVVLHALKKMLMAYGSIDYVCCIYATAPFIQPEYIRQGFELLCKHGAMSAFSVTSFSSPVFRALKINSDGRLEMFWPDHLNTRSQDLPDAYHDAGQFYWAETKNYLKKQLFYSKDAIPVILPRYLVQDIDTPEDWETAEFMFKAINSGQK